MGREFIEYENVFPHSEAYVVGTFESYMASSSSSSSKLLRLLNAEKKTPFCLLFPYILFFQHLRLELARRFQEY